MKNVAIVIHKLYGGGAEHAACNLSLFLRKSFSTTLIAFDAQNAAYPHCEDVVDLRVPAANRFVQRLMLLPKRVQRLRKVKRDKHIDASIALLPGPSMASALARRKGERIIMSVRNYLSAQQGTGFLSRYKTKLTAGLSDCVVAVSRMAALDLQTNYGIPEEKLRVIYNAVDPSLLSDTYDPSAPWLQSNGKLIITMGRLHGQKGHWHLIRAMKKVTEQLPDCKLLLLGDGEYKERLQTLARELGIEENIFLPGYVVAPHGYVRKADLFVLSSLYEGMPNAMLEAMACGIPVVSTDCPSGPREILAPASSVTDVAAQTEFAEYGVLLPRLDKGHFDTSSPLTNEETALADALLGLLTDDNLHAEYAQKALTRAADFAPEIIETQWSELVKTLIDKR